MIIYDYNILPAKNIRIPIEIIETGSNGNSTLIQPIKCLIDLGVSYAKIQPYLSKIDTICLTHKHGDHLNLSTLKQILSVHPRIKIIIPMNLFNAIEDYTIQHLLNKQGTIIQHKQAIIIEDQYKLTGYDTPHGDIINMAYTFYIPKYQTHLLYATDLEDTNTLPKASFNLILLEANYDEILLNNLLQDAINNYDKESMFRLQNNKRHLSQEAAVRYVKENLIKTGYFIPLHASKTFGTFHQY